MLWLLTGLKNTLVTDFDTFVTSLETLVNDLSALIKVFIRWLRIREVGYEFSCVRYGIRNTGYEF